jgi:hypothetical protein
MWLCFPFTPLSFCPFTPTTKGKLLSGSVEINAVESEALATPPITERREVAETGTRAIVFALALMFVLGLGLRLSGVSAIGFAEDEINKLEAVRAYEQGDIRPNAEHPMLMKALMYISMQTAKAWNARGACKHCER